MIELFLRWQMPVIIGLAILCSAIVLLIDYRGVAAAIFSLFSILIVFAGQKLYIGHTSENWSKFSWKDIFRSALGGALMLLGWIGFLRGVIALAIASIILRMG